jgi:hypothetical protein
MPSYHVPTYKIINFMCVIYLKKLNASISNTHFIKAPKKGDSANCRKTCTCHEFTASNFAAEIENDGAADGNSRE